MAEALNDGWQSQAVDTTAEGIRGARRQLDELQKPGPRAPFQSTPLTSLDPNPFENRPGPKASDERQVATSARCREGCTITACSCSATWVHCTSAEARGCCLMQSMASWQLTRGALLPAGRVLQEQAALLRQWPGPGQRSQHVCRCRGGGRAGLAAVSLAAGAALLGPW